MDHVSTTETIDVLDGRGFPRLTWIPQLRSVEVPEGACRLLGLNLNYRWSVTVVLWFDYAWSFTNYRPFDRRYDRKIPGAEEWFSGPQVGG